MAKRIWLLCGLAFSGKSTLARAISESRGARVISLDGINEERGVGFGGEGLAPEVWGETFGIALGRLDTALARGEEVVIDDTSCFRFLRDRYREVGGRHGYDVLLVVLDVPSIEIERRRRRNEASGERRPIQDEVFDSLVASFEWPGEDERPLRFSPGEDPDSWIDGITGPPARD
ncbi:MAG: ATP-binding protein [Holophagales bacterium]|nr:ATP-binding protein [Holophagales bacterium]